MSSSNDTTVSSSSPVIRRRIPRSRRRRDGLIQYAKDITSQNGEDGIIAKIFTVLPPQRRQRYCVDIGAWDGRHLSNTFSLLVPNNGDHAHYSSNSSSKTNNGIDGDNDNDNNSESSLPDSVACSSWKGILIEADRDKFIELQTLHEKLGNICINATVSSDPSSQDSLVSILEREVGAELPKDFDFLCIDVDGSDYWLLYEVFECRYRPKVICIEANPTMPNDLIYIPARNDTMRHGCSLAALIELAEKYNYVLIETTLYNAFFVPTDLYQKYLFTHVPDDTSIEALHETTMGTELYQLYDGTIKLWGCKKLLWHRIKLDEARMQMIPPSQRTFPFAPIRGDITKIKNDSAIDMSAYCQQQQLLLPINNNDKDHDNTSNKMAAANRLIEQLKADGFALVRGTGISAQLVRETLRVTHSFLQDSDESVRRSCLSKRDRARRGYSPANTENFASLLGESGPNDLVRKFRMGTSSNHFSSTLLQENVWPLPTASANWDTADCDDFQSTVEDYYDKICFVANEIVQCICDGLLLEYPDLSPALQPLLATSSSITKRQTKDEEENHNISENSSFAHNTSILTLLGYRTGSRHKKAHQKKKRIVHPLVSAHTDIGVITVLIHDGGDCAALQRQLKNTNVDENQLFENVILPAQIQDDPVFVVNIADCLSAITGERLPSTVHRVVPQDGVIHRNCLALFTGFKGEQKLTINGEEISYEAWRKKRVKESLSVLRSCT